MSEAIWFVINGHKEEGPYSPGQLDNLHRDGKIKDDTVLRRKGDVKRYTVKQALAVKRQVQKNQMANAAPISAMGQLYQSTAFRAFLLFVLLLVVAGASLYFTGQYKNPPFSEWLKAIGFDVNAP